MAAVQSTSSRLCLQCGGSNERHGKRGPQARYCSWECKDRARVLKRTPRGEKACLTCGRVVVLTAGQKYCSLACGQRRQKDAICKRCGSFLRVRKGSAGCYCRPCRLTIGHQTQVANLASEPARRCPECLCDFQPTRKMQRFCVRDCGHRWYTRAKKIRHARAMVDEDISIGGVFDRCGGVCGICGLAVERRYRCPDARSATIDHVVAISNGGLHEWGNVQLAHFGCNSRKGNR